MSKEQKDIYLNSPLTGNILISGAPGTGKTVIAFHICWKLFKSKWNKNYDGSRTPKIKSIIVDFPAPLEPIIAILSLKFIRKEVFSIILLSFLL